MPPAPPEQDSTSIEAPAAGWADIVRRFLPLAGLILVAVVAYWSGLPQRVAPSALEREYAEIRSLALSSPVLAIGVFILGYAVLSAACLPVPLMLSLLSGAIFGVWIAAPSVLAGGTAGALLTYAATRSAFAPFLLQRAARDQRLNGVIAGFGRNAFSYILTLRLIPMVPFALVNVASGVAAAPIRPFVAATLLGGAPTAFVYTGLGAGLGAAIGSQHSLREALNSPRLLLPLAGLGLLALAAPVGNWLRARAKRRADP